MAAELLLAIAAVNSMAYCTVCVLVMDEPSTFSKPSNPVLITPQNRVNRVLNDYFSQASNRGAWRGEWKRRRTLVVDEDYDGKMH